MGAYTHNFVANGNLELWDAGPVPQLMDAQVTSTVITDLDLLTLQVEHLAWTNQRLLQDKFVYEGHHALRATIAAAGVADDFRLFPEGTLVALTGLSLYHLDFNLLGNFDHRFAFTFAARNSVDGNLVRLRLVLRDNGDAIRLYLNNAGHWQAGATQIDFGTLQVWRRFGITTDPIPYNDGAGNIIENMVWQVSNGSAGAQVLDLDDLQLTDLKVSFAAP